MSRNTVNYYNTDFSMDGFLSVGNLSSVQNITGSGAINISAGGIDQSINLTPTGTGRINGPTFTATSTTNGGFQGIGADSATVPSFTWSGDLDTGMYRSGTNQIGFTTAGVQRLRISTTTVVITANLTVSGSVSKGSGSFKIDHPLPEKTETHHLVHSFIEGLRADLIYRGRVDLVNGEAYVNIDQSAGMTEGTFVALCRDIQCFVSNETDWDAVKGKVTGNQLHIRCQNQQSTATISWLVIGERQDKHMYDTDWTDDNGRVIVEPLKVKPVEQPQSV